MNSFEKIDAGNLARELRECKETLAAERLERKRSDKAWAEQCAERAQNVADANNRACDAQEALEEACQKFQHEESRAVKFQSVIEFLAAAPYFDVDPGLYDGGDVADSCRTWLDRGGLDDEEQELLERYRREAGKP